MERVQTLINRLNEQFAQQASPNELLVTVQLLQSELMHLRSVHPKNAVPHEASLHIAPSFENNIKPDEEQDTEPQKIIEVLQIDEAEVEAELEEIKRNAEIRNNISTQNKPHLLFDPVEDIPTLAHQQPVPEMRSFEPQKFAEEQKLKKEVHESIGTTNEASINDKLKQIKIELSDALKDVPIRDLKKAVGVNDRFLFINELFRGDEVMYERSIKTINGFSIFPEAEYWIKRELKLKLGWNDNNEVVKQFDQLVKRRFS